MHQGFCKDASYAKGREGPQFLFIQIEFTIDCWVWVFPNSNVNRYGWFSLVKISLPAFPLWDR